MGYPPIRRYRAMSVANRPVPPHAPPPPLTSPPSPGRPLPIAPSSGNANHHSSSRSCLNQDAAVRPRSTSTPIGRGGGLWIARAVRGPRPGVRRLDAALDSAVGRVRRTRPAESARSMTSDRSIPWAGRAPERALKYLAAWRPRVPTARPRRYGTGLECADVSALWIPAGRRRRDLASRASPHSAILPCASRAHPERRRAAALQTRLH